MKTILITFSILSIIFSTSFSYAETTKNEEKPSITIEECLAKARNNYPLYKNKQLIEDALKLDITKNNMSLIPEIKISGKATYQSEVTSMPFSFPGYNIEPLNKDQYQINAEISQKIFDANSMWAKKDVLKARSASDAAMLETNLYNVQNSVINVYFNILLLYERLAQNDIYIEELGRNYKTVENHQKNGVAQRSDLDLINVEIITALKNREDMQSSRESAFDALAVFIGVNPRDYNISVPDNLAKLRELQNSPLFSSSTQSGYQKDYSYMEELLNKRPEIYYYETKASELEMNKKTVIAGGLPMIDVFFQGGYGNPGLDFLKNEFTPYYMAGIRLNWSFSSLYTKDKENEIVANQKLQLISQKNEFLFNSKITIEQKLREIESLRKQLEADEKIIGLRLNIVKASESKMRNGVMSVSDLLTDISKLNDARQEKSYRKIGLLMKIYELKQTLNLWD